MTDPDRRALLERLERNRAQRDERSSLLDRLRSTTTKVQETPLDADAGDLAPEEDAVSRVGAGEAPADLADVLARHRQSSSRLDLLQRLERDRPRTAEAEETSEPEPDELELPDQDEFSWRAQFSGPIPDHTEQIRLARAIEAGVLAQACLDGELELPFKGTPEELSEIARIGRTSLEQFIRGNLRLVLHFAVRSNPALEIEDKFQYGYFGLRRAIEGWDWRRGYTFATYASHQIRQAIARGVANDVWSIRVPVHVHEVLNREAGELAAEVSADERTSIRAGRRVAAGIWSLEELAELLDETADDHDYQCQDPSEWVDDRVTLAEAVDLAMTDLEPRERGIVQLRSGMHDEPLTLDEIGNREGVTRERIRQIESKAEAKLRNALWELAYTWYGPRTLFEAAATSDPGVMRLLRHPNAQRHLAEHAQRLNVSKEWLQQEIRRVLETVR